MSWFCSVCEKSLSRKDSMQRHVMAKQRKACLTPFQTVAMPSKNMSAVSLRASFHLHGYRGDQVWKRQYGFDLNYSKLQGQFPLPHSG